MQNIDKAAHVYKELLELVGEDTERDGLKDTPMRAAKAMAFLTKGYEQDLQTVTKWLSSRI